jgi:transcriptional regulator with XRE-family HTH domain
MNEAQLLNRATVVLIQLRMQHNYTQLFVANELDLNISAYSRIESGKQKLTLTNLFRLSRLYSMSVTDIVALIETEGVNLKKAV